MSKILADIDISLDGFVAGESPSPENPLGKGGERLIWYGDDVNELNTDLETSYGGIDGKVLQEAAKNEGAVIMGRKTFDVSINSWGDNPPIHKPCFVLTHKSQAMIEKEGGTSFTFVTDGPVEAVRLARIAAKEKDVSVIGGANTIQQLIVKGLLDELRIHILPVLLGKGIRLFHEGLSRSVCFEKARVIDGERATHIFLKPKITSKLSFQPVRR